MVFNLLIFNIKNLLFVFSLLVCVPLYANGPDCHGFYTQKTGLHFSLKKKIHEFRTSRLQKAATPQMVVNGVVYKIIGKLGGDRTRVQVYLCEAPNGKLVQIKRIYDNTTWPNSIYYEMAVTRYYQENGLIVPSIIDHSVEYTDVLGSKYMNAIVVKEYFEGMTGSELFFGDEAFTDAEVDHMNQRIETYRGRVATTHRGFKDWLKANNIDLYKTEFSQMNLLIEKGDIDGQNILYNATIDDGVIFDP